MCLASLAKGMPRARPDKVPSASTLTRSLGPAGATVIAPSGRGDVCLRQQPSGQHGLGERHAERETARRAQHAKTFGEASRPNRRTSSETHDNGRPASVSACQSGVFQPPFLSRLMVCASARSANILSAVSATILSTSATAFPVQPAHIPRANCAGPQVRSFLASA